MMPETKPQILSGVAETLLITLYIRAEESQRPDALIQDVKAVALVKKLGYDFNRIGLLHLDEANKLVLILRNREFDRYTQKFLARHPDAAVVHIGCGLDSRFERVDNGRVEWYDLDLPDVIALRRELLGGESNRYHLLGSSVLENTWLKAVSAAQQRLFLFVAEGLSMHLEEAQNKRLVQLLCENFPGAELVFDAFSPIHNRVSNLKTARFGLRTHWGTWHGREVEGWHSGIQLLGEWGYFDSHEPRLSPIRWLRPFDALFRTLRIYHYRLGEAPK